MGSVLCFAGKESVKEAGEALTHFLTQRGTRRIQTSLLRHREVSGGKQGWEGFLEESEMWPGRQGQAEMVT